jgi:hypothetical protein
MNLILSNSKIKISKESLITVSKNQEYLAIKTEFSSRKKTYLAEYFVEHREVSEKSHNCRHNKQGFFKPYIVKTKLIKFFHDGGYVQIDVHTHKDGENRAIFTELIKLIRKEERHNKIICDGCLDDKLKNQQKVSTERRYFVVKIKDVPPY